MRDRIRTASALVLALLLVLGLAGCDGDTAPAEDTATDTEDSQTEADDGEDTQMAFAVTSTAFEADGEIPLAYAREGAGGDNLSPPLAWEGAPADAASFAVVMVDRHPIANEWIHWMVVDIPADVAELREDASLMAIPGRELANTFGEVGYGGPEPPPGSGAHEYEITVYALDATTLDIADDADFTTFLDAVTSHSLDAAVLSGYFEQ